jgi:hypothetical protein
MQRRSLFPIRCIDIGAVLEQHLHSFSTAHGRREMQWCPVDVILCGHVCAVLEQYPDGFDLRNGNPLMGGSEEPVALFIHVSCVLDSCTVCH